MASTEFLAGLAGGMQGLEEGLADLRERIKEAKNKREKKEALQAYRDALIEGGYSKADANAEMYAASQGKLGAHITGETTRGKTRAETKLTGEKAKTEEQEGISLFLKNLLDQTYGEKERQAGLGLTAEQTRSAGATADLTGARQLQTEAKTAEIGKGGGKFGLPTDAETYNNVWEKAHAYAEKRVSFHHKNWYSKYAGKRDSMDPLIGQLFSGSGQPAKEALPNDVVPPEEPAWEDEYEKYIQEYLMARYGVGTFGELGANVKREKPLKEGEVGSKNGGNAIREKFGRDTGFQFGPPVPGGPEEDGGTTAPPVVDDELKQKIMEMLKDPDLANDPDVQRTARELGLL